MFATGLKAGLKDFTSFSLRQLTQSQLPLRETLPQCQWGAWRRCFSGSRVTASREAFPDFQDDIYTDLKICDIYKHDKLGVVRETLGGDSFLFIPTREDALEVINQGLPAYDNSTDSPALSLQVPKAAPLKGQIPVPLAVKKGVPLTPEEANKLNPEEDIWVVRGEKQDVDWKPPKTHTDVLQSDGFKLRMQLLDIACRKVIPGLLDDGEVPIFKFRNKMEEKEFAEIVSSSILPGNKDPFALARNRKGFKQMISIFNTAIQSGWPNGEGRNAMSGFLRAALDVCDDHVVALQIAGREVQNNLEIETFMLNYGGNSKSNVHNSRYAVKYMKFAKTVKFEDRVDALRSPGIWVDEETTDIAKGWCFGNAAPDVLIWASREIGQTAQMDGLLVGEVKSSADGITAAEDQAFVHALRGLLFRPNSAAVVMSPNAATFIDIAVEKGFIDTKKKRYLLVPGVGVNSEVDSTAYQELFHDIVLYLWNTYYAEKCLTK